MKEDFKENLQKDTELQAQVLDVLKTTELGKAYAETIAKNYFEQNVSNEHKKIYDFVDNALMESGLEKPAGVKTSEWAKMIAEQNKELKDKIETFKSNSDPDKSLKQIQELKTKHKKEKAELTNAAQAQIKEKESIINSLKEKEKKFLIESEIQKVISSMNFNKGLDESLINDIITLKTQSLISNRTEEDGNITWNKADGSAYKDGILNASLDFVLKEELKAIIEHNAAGGGAGNTPINAADFNGSQVIIPESSYQTQEQFLAEFDKIAIRKGIPKGEQYDNLYWEAFERYNIKNLKEY